MLFWRHRLKTRCADKYAMRSYVEEHGLGDLLPELLGVYESSAEIEFETLPDSFVLKCTHGSGCNIICGAKSALDCSEAQRRLDQWMRRDYSKVGGEIHYSLIKPRIIAESFLDDGTGAAPSDYKIYCFGGIAYCTMACTERATGKPKFDFYDRAWRTNSLTPSPACSPTGGSRNRQGTRDAGCRRGVVEALSIRAHGFL